MKIEQISIFLENTNGRLAEVTRILGNHQINLRAISIADTADFGILRLIVDHPQKSLEILKAEGFTATVTEVIGVEVPDQPGGLSQVMHTFEENNVNIEYLYSSLERNRNRAVVMFRIENIDQGLQILQEKGVTLVKNFE